ncbi:MAG: glycosyltransferase family 39 protein [Brevefilum sp.]|nr:glycosyltransferase family 39 protein [Brevefilum sp.]
MKTKTIILNGICLIILVTLVILSALYFYPYAMEVPHRDSGIYLYLGRELLDGKTIYREVWEHKPPFIFYINALGLFLGGGSGWGVWGVEVAFLIMTVFLSYFLLRQVFKPITSLLITTAAYLAAFQYMSGNFTEEYALLFSAAIVFIFLSPGIKTRQLRQYFIIGILTGILFNIKQTYIDVAIAIGLLLFAEMIIEKQWLNFKVLVSIGIGFIIPNMFVFFIMLINNAVRDWWNAAFVYNFAYSDIAPMARIYALIDIFQVNSQYPFFVLTFLAWIGGVLYLIRLSFPHLVRFLLTKKGKLLLLLSALFFMVLVGVGELMSTKPGIGLIQTIVLSFGVIFVILFLLFSFVLKDIKRDPPKTIRLTSWQPLENQKIIHINDPLLLGIVHYPIVLFLATASGRNYPHYFIPFYASIILIITGAWLLLTQMDRKHSRPYLSSILFLALFIIGLTQPGRRLLRGMGGPYSYNPFRELVQYITENSDEDDQVMVWGLETGINYISNRSAPSRFSYVDSLYYHSPLQAESAAILLDDITSNPPKFILDTRNPAYPFINGMSMEDCLLTHPADGTDLEKIIHFTCSNYQHIDRVNGAEIYQRID